jgi:hypothetical protein
MPERHTQRKPDKPDTSHKRSLHQIDMDRIKMMDMMRRGKTPSQIAQRLGVSVNQVHYDYKQVMKQFNRDHVKNIERVVAMKLAEYSEIKSEAWDAWEESKKDFVKEVVEDYPLDDGTAPGGAKRTRTVEGQCGDSKFLHIVIQCVNAERELLGLNAPKEHRVSGQFVNLDMVVQQIPESGPVPNSVGLELKKALDALPPPISGGNSRDVIDVKAEKRK